MQPKAAYVGRASLESNEQDANIRLRVELARLTEYLEAFMQYPAALSGIFSKRFPFGGAKKALVFRAIPIILAELVSRFCRKKKGTPRLLGGCV
jgi:hypothetical protein